MIYDDLRHQLKQAIRDNNENKVYIRSALARITEYSVENNFDRSVALPDEEVIKVLISIKKSLEKAIQMFQKGGKEDDELIHQYRKEIKFYEQFIPQEDNSHIEKWVDEAVETLQITDVKMAGKIIGYIMKTHKNEQPDGSIVKQLVMEKLKGE